MNARHVSRAAAALLLLGLLGCGEATVEVELRSLQASSEITFVCRTADGTGTERGACPDYDDGATSLYALVTQTATEEVAIIDVARARVVDLDPSAPGFAFQRLASRPGDIVSSPGGAATFVGLEGVGKPGISALPTTCLGPPVRNPDGSLQTKRDVTSLPTCHLPSTPGDMIVLVEPPSADGAIQQSCDGALGPEDTAPPAASAECAANLTLEPGPVGRRKLAVSLPDEGRIVVIDAQWLLDRSPGTFENCRIDASLELAVELGPSGIRQEVPPDLVPPAGCVLSQPVTPADPPSYLPRPAGFAHAANRLYVADQVAPVVHVLDVARPCALAELPPLLPMEFERPGRAVTTSRVAVSPLTPSGKRFVYAIDQDDPVKPSVMVFDVSVGGANRTPLVRAGTPRLPLEPPDRIRLGTTIADVAFALRDLPAADPNTGVAEAGVRCDPNPDAPSDSPGAQYRPSSDTTRGAQPRLLRGLFGLAMLTTGHVAIIDVDDFDAPCRRPITTNPFSEEDYRGCASDEGLPPFLTNNRGPDGAPTVTNEVSCRAVEPHRIRSSTLALSSATVGPGAPSLIALPQFTTPDPSVEIEPRARPKLLAVNFPGSDPDGVPPEVFVGTRRLAKGLSGGELPTDPNVATQSSLALPWVEPRAYPATDELELTYEGRILGPLPAGFIQLGGAGTSLEDPNGDFCDNGIYDVDAMRDYGATELAVPSERLDAFAQSHADFVQVTGELLPVEDAYWRSPRAISCGSYPVCSDTFGSNDERNLSPARELSIREAYQGRLVVTPRNAESDEEREALADLFECCFPDGVEYTLRVSRQWVLTGSVSGYRHDLVASGADFRCVRDCNPRKAFARSRAFEITSSENCGDECGVGRGSDDDACGYDARGRVSDGEGGGVKLSDPEASACIFEGLTARFAIYRGLAPSVRGMAFTWQTTGGFRPLVASLTSVSVSVRPRHIEYLPEFQSIAIVDEVSLGLSLVSLDTLRLERPWPVF